MGELLSLRGGGLLGFLGLCWGFPGVWGSGVLRVLGVLGLSEFVVFRAFGLVASGLACLEFRGSLLLGTQSSPEDMSTRAQAPGGMKSASVRPSSCSPRAAGLGV